MIEANEAARRAFALEGEKTPLSRIFRDPGLLRALASVRDKRQPANLAFSPVASPDRRYAAHIEPVTITEGGRGVVLLLREESELVLIERMRSDFIANVSHELRTPLASITGFIETLQGPAREDAEARSAFLEIMATEATRMRRLVDDLLALSRIELASHRPPGETRDPADLARELLERIQPVADKAGIELVHMVDGTLPAITADGDQLLQALSNLVENAIKYGAEGKTVRMAVTHHHDAGDAAGSLAGAPAVEFAVIDHGQGIAAEHLPRLTERFYRVDKARSRKIGGTGLGLAIVKHIVRRHQGHLHIESRPGEGSRFSIFVPAGPAG
ncbi:MAG: ATP-binding protein [Geminicoccaceae bacterium]